MEDGAMTASITPGHFGLLGLGSIDGRPGRFTARGYDIPGVTGLAMGRFGPNGYGADTSMWQSPGDCETGIWTTPVMPPPAYRKSRPYGVGAYGVGPYERYAGAWAKPTTCSVGTWARAA
jgi:hypothetical protein